MPLLASGRRYGLSSSASGGKDMHFRFRVATLAAAAALISVIGCRTAHAQEAPIGNGQTVSVPGDHASPWNINNLLIVGAVVVGRLSSTDGGAVTNVSYRVHWRI